MRSVEVSADNETPVFFSAGDNDLFGILTRPVSPNGNQSNRAVVVLSGGGSPTSLSRNRLSIRMCRRLSAYGFMAMRFDYHGVGESSGEVGQFHLGKPFSDDIVAATDWLRKNDAHDFVLVGSCFGARTALAGSNLIPEIAGVVLVCPPVRDFAMGERTSTRLARDLGLFDYLRRGLRPRVIRGLIDRDSRKAYWKVAHAKWRAISSSWSKREFHRAGRARSDSWVSESFIANLQGLVERSVPVLLVYGKNDEFYREFDEARLGQLGQIMNEARQLIEVQTIEGRLHGFLTLDSQDKVLDIVSEWVHRRVNRTSLLSW